MKKTPHGSLESLRFVLPWAINILFYGSVCWIITISELPPVPGPVFLMRKQFLEGNTAFFSIQDPGLPYAIFEPFLPRKGSVSFLADTPYNPEHTSTEQLQAAQNRLTPLLLNHDPVERIALAFCSQKAIAAARLQAAGYRAAKDLGNGKMIGEKKS